MASPAANAPAPPQAASPDHARSIDELSDNHQRLLQLGSQMQQYQLDCPEFKSSLAEDAIPVFPCVGKQSSGKSRCLNCCAGDKVCLERAGLGNCCNVICSYERTEGQAGKIFSCGPYRSEMEEFTEGQKLGEKVAAHHQQLRESAHQFDFERPYYTKVSGPNMPTFTWIDTIGIRDDSSRESREQNAAIVKNIQNLCADHSATPVVITTLGARPDPECFRAEVFHVSQAIGDDKDQGMFDVARRSILFVNMIDKEIDQIKRDGKAYFKTRFDIAAEYGFREGEVFFVSLRPEILLKNLQSGGSAVISDTNEDNSAYFASGMRALDAEGSKELCRMLNINSSDPYRIGFSAFANSLQQRLLERITANLNPVTAAYSARTQQLTTLAHGLLIKKPNKDQIEDALKLLCEGAPFLIKHVVNEDFRCFRSTAERMRRRLMTMNTKQQQQQTESGSDSEDDVMLVDEVDECGDLVLSVFNEIKTRISRTFEEEIALMRDIPGVAKHFRAEDFSAEMIANLPAELKTIAGDRRCGNSSTLRLLQIFGYWMHTRHIEPVTAAEFRVVASDDNTRTVSEKIDQGIAEFVTRRRHEAHRLYRVILRWVEEINKELAEVTVMQSKRLCNPLAQYPYLDEKARHSIITHYSLFFQTQRDTAYNMMVTYSQQQDRLRTSEIPRTLAMILSSGFEMCMFQHSLRIADKNDAMNQTAGSAAAAALGTAAAAAASASLGVSGTQVGQAVEKTVVSKVKQFLGKKRISSQPDEDKDHPLYMFQTYRVAPVEFVLTNTLFIRQFADHNVPEHMDIINKCISMFVRINNGNAQLRLERLVDNVMHGPARENEDIHSIMSQSIQYVFQNWTRDETKLTLLAHGSKDFQIEKITACLADIDRHIRPQQLLQQCLADSNQEKCRVAVNKEVNVLEEKQNELKELLEMLRTNDTDDASSKEWSKQLHKITRVTPHTMSADKLPLPTDKGIYSDLMWQLREARTGKPDARRDKEVSELKMQLQELQNVVKARDREVQRLKERLNVNVSRPADPEAAVNPPSTHSTVDPSPDATADAPTVVPATDPVIAPAANLTGVPSLSNAEPAPAPTAQATAAESADTADNDK